MKFLHLKSVWTAGASRWADASHSDWQHCLLSGGRGVHGAPQCTRNPLHTYLRALSVLQVIGMGPYARSDRPILQDISHMKPSVSANKAIQSISATANAVMSWMQQLQCISCLLLCPIKQSGTHERADSIPLQLLTGSFTMSCSNVPCCICRPVILPDYAELDLKIPDDARCPAWVCFDGKQVSL